MKFLAVCACLLALSYVAFCYKEEHKSTEYQKTIAALELKVNKLVEQSKKENQTRDQLVCETKRLYPNAVSCDGGFSCGTDKKCDTLLNICIPLDDLGFQGE